MCEKIGMREFWVSHTEMTTLVLNVERGLNWSTVIYSSFRQNSRNSNKTFRSFQSTPDDADVADRDLRRIRNSFHVSRRCSTGNLWNSSLVYFYHLLQAGGEWIENECKFLLFVRQKKNTKFNTFPSSSCWFIHCRDDHRADRGHSRDRTKKIPFFSTLCIQIFASLIPPHLPASFACFV